MKNQKNRILLAAIYVAAGFTALAQEPPATAAQDRLKGYEKRQTLLKNSQINNIPFRSVGPTVMSGRVVDLEVDPANPQHFYAAYASGGLWETLDNGASFKPIFEGQASMTIGDIAVNWAKPGMIWVGSGENNSSRSSYAGTGIYKTSDNGKTWEHLGLEDSHHIGRIVLHPTDEKTAWVGVMGHLYSPNDERGLYKTSDGGKKWAKKLFVNANAGIIDLAMEPGNPQTLYAASWERTRRAYDFIGNGKGTGLYKSVDGGETWQQLNTAGSGFPNSAGAGRIGLSVSPSNPSTVYAILDNQDRRETKEEPEMYPVNKKMLASISDKDFLNLKDEDINDYLDRSGFETKYSAAGIKADIKAGKIKPTALVDYLDDANSDLFDTPIKGCELYKSVDAGKTWAKTHEGYLDDIFYTYGYYFAQVRTDASNPDRLYIMGVPILRSDDGGKNWKSVNGDNVHADHHALWVNPADGKHIINGDDGGVNISYNGGESWTKCNSLAVGQFYTVNVDMAVPYNIYGGLQDNGVWVGPSTYEPSVSWHEEGQYPYKRLIGGDGMQVAIDTRDNNTVYTGYQFGHYYRIDQATGKRHYIHPKHELGEKPLRFNWQTPVILSAHNQDIVYMGSNKFHRSMNKAQSFETLSGDLTLGGKAGNVPYGTISSLHESPLKFGLLYAGTDDGLIHISKDGGYTWANIAKGLPEMFWVSRVQASKHKEGRVYVSLNGYRSDNFEALVYVSEDYGTLWKRLGNDLPAEPVNVIKEDPENENILYVGTDNGLYVSLDRGKEFMGMNNNLPAVAVHDLVVHPRDKELVVGTHGRSIYIADVSHLQKLDAEMLAKKLYLFDMEEKNHHTEWGNAYWSRWLKSFIPETQAVFYSSKEGKAKITLKTAKGLTLKKFEEEAEKGLNYFKYDYTLDKEAVEAYLKELNAAKKEGASEIKAKAAGNGLFYLLPGEYVLELSLGNETAKGKLIIKPAAPKTPRSAKKTP